MARVLFRDDEGVEGEVRLSATETVFIGRGVECAVRTTSSMVSRRHAQICWEGRRYIVEDLGSANGTFVNKVRVQKHVFAHADVVQCGSLFLRFDDDGDDDVPADEAALLDDITRGDDDSRLVYADWLEQHADLSRAEYLRLQETLAVALGTTTMPWEDARIVRLRELARAIPFAWRERVVDPRTGDPCRECGSLYRVQRGPCRACSPRPMIANPPRPAGKLCACGASNPWFATTCASCSAAL